MFFFFFFSSRRRHTRFDCDWSSDVCSSDLTMPRAAVGRWHRCVTVPIDCRSREASLLSKNIDVVGALVRSEEHTSELQSQSNLVCRLLLEKKKILQFRENCWFNFCSDLGQS